MNIQKNYKKIIMKKSIIKYTLLLIILLGIVLIRGFFGGIILGIVLAIVFFELLGSRLLTKMERRDKIVRESIARISAAIKE